MSGLIEQVNTEFLALPGGRRLAYAQFGQADGKPVLYFHGSPGSRLEGLIFDAECKQRGLRLVAVDRPGMGASDFTGGHTWGELAADTAALADHLGIDTFSVVGYSGGGTMAQACAYALPERVERAILIGSWAPVYAEPALFAMLAPLDRFFYNVGKRIPALFNLPFAMFLISARYMSPEAFFNSIKSSMSEADREAIQDPAMAQLLHQDMVEAFAQGVRGPGYDALIQYRDWGFAIEEIGVPVHILHGTEDKFAPYCFAEYLQAHIQGASLHTYPGDGHFAIHTRFGELLEALGE
jgi:pimeloyl-ACP methyl ester carboxylesterase